MKGELTKSYDRSLLINEEQFRSIASYVEDSFVDVDYKIYTSDGANYSMDAKDEVLSYINPDSRRIIKIVISGNKDHRDRSFYKDFSLTLFDMSKFDKSCILTLNNMEEKDIVFYSQRIDEFVKSAQEPLWWIHKTAVYIVIWVLLYAIAAVFYFTKTDKAQLADKAYNMVFLNEYFNRLNKTRNLILITILGTIVLGIISGVITHLIVS